jgi:hypothetical protein
MSLWMLVEEVRLEEEELVSGVGGQVERGVLNFAPRGQRCVSERINRRV